MGNIFVKFKRDVERKNSGLYSFRPTVPKKDITHRFNLATPKEALMNILYGYVIFKAEIRHRKHMF